ncbi:MAG: hypothetical protein ACXVYY_15270 [Oryzihumus sp.]
MSPAAPTVWQARHELYADPESPLSRRLAVVQRHVRVWLEDRGGAPARVRVLEGDAALVDLWAESVPADLVLLCGVLGNISDADVERTRAAGAVRGAGGACSPSRPEPTRVRG